MNKQKILIVDDDENIAELVSLYLTKECFDTMMVHDGERALVAFDTYKPNLILLDLMSVARSVRDLTLRSSCCPPRVKYSTRYLAWSSVQMITL